MSTFFAEFPVSGGGGTTITIGVPANGLTLVSGVLSLGLASTSTTGALSSTDWNTFNSKFNLPSLTAGSVVFSNGTTLAQDNANFFWADSTDRLGIGTTNPLVDIHILKSVSGNPVTLISENSSATANSDAHVRVKTAVGGGNPHFIASVDDSNYWSFGLDQADSMSFKIAPSNALATSTALRISTAGVVNIPNLTASLPVKTGASKDLISAAINLASAEVTGTLPVSKGGTGSATAFTLGSVIFAGASGTYTQDNANFFWDDTNNRLGINTTTPLAPLDISNGSIAIVLGADNASTSRTNTTTKFGRMGFPHYDNAQLPMAGFISQANSTQNILSIGGGTGLFNAATSIAFFTAANNISSTGTERMTITPTGLVGIGTASPASPLHVLENTSGVSTSTGLTLQQSGTGDAIIQYLLTGAQRWVTGIDNSDSDKFKIASGADLSSANTRMTIDIAGNVGIGTQSPQTLLHTASTSNVFRMEDSDGVAAGTQTTLVDFYAASTLIGRMGYATSNGTMQINNLYNNIDLSTGSAGTSTLRMRIHNSGGVAVGTYASSNTPPTDGMIISGNVGIGTASPNTSALLDITSTTEGFLQPRMTTTQRNAITTPATGLSVYDTTIQAPYYYNGTSWQTIAGTPIVARYVDTSGQSIGTGATTIVNFNTATFDTSGFVTTGASWKFENLATTTGIFDVSAQLNLVSNTGGGSLIIYIYKNGARYSTNYTLTGGAAPYAVNISDKVQLAPNDYIDIRILQNAGVARSLTASASYVAINKIK